MRGRNRDMRTRTGCDRDHRRAGGLCSEASRTAARADAATKLARVTAAPPTARFDLDIEGVPRTQRAQALLDAVPAPDWLRDARRSQPAHASVAGQLEVAR